jgi:quercetin dioxygenase-like cupin family protein
MHPIAAQPTAAPAYAFFDTVAIVRATSEQTMGHYSLLEIRSHRGQQPPLHSHDHDDEGFYVLDGEVRLHVGPDTICLGPGQCAVAPRDIPHTYVVESERATWLVASNGGLTATSRRSARRSTTPGSRSTSSSRRWSGSSKSPQRTASRSSGPPEPSPHDPRLRCRRAVGAAALIRPAPASRCSSTATSEPPARAEVGGHRTGIELNPRDRGLE